LRNPRSIDGTSGDDAEPPERHHRRPRYAGTHPKRFEQKYKEHNLAAYPEIEAHLRAKGNTPAGTHIPILTQEILACLKPQPGDIVADCTVGYGGHAREFIRRIGPAGRLIGFDVDGAELDRTRQRLGAENVPLSLYRSNFAGIANVLATEGLDGYDIIFADLGVSSMQIDDPQRGMSYKRDGPLDLRMDDRLRRTGADLLNSLSEAELAQALWELADEPDHEKIAHLIVTQRATEPIARTSQLAALVCAAQGLTLKSWHQQQRLSKHRCLHPAARTFQALRMLVNDELGSLRELLRVTPYCLRRGGRVGIISFHSGEDRLVKQSFRDGLRTGLYQSAADDPITPSREETTANPRSSPAKFRWAAAPTQH
jgi:16S rRNA (cytosine1402-N4)-methyltransferase